MTTEIIKIGELNDKAISDLTRAADVIKNGGLVVFPTETVYGLGADATNSEAAEKIYSAKSRPADNPLIIHISEPQEASKYTFTNSIYDELAKAFMPGPLTVVLPAKTIIPNETRAYLPTVAVRCPSNVIARTLIKLSGVPIAAPSANLSGSPSPTKASHVIDDMLGRVDIIIDGGDADFGLESTIVKIEDDGSLTLLRPGKITVDDLSRITPCIKIADAVTEKLREGEKVLSPGMKYRHYAPKCDVFLLDGEFAKICSYLKERAENSKIAILCYNEDIKSIKEEAPTAYIYSFGDKDDEITQARNLFDLLRDVDKRDFDEVYAPLPRRGGIGLALYNRMIRAAAYHIIRL